MHGSPLIDQSLAFSISNIEHFKDSAQANFGADDLLEYYSRWFVGPLLRGGPMLGSVADVGAGYGWLPIALALTTDPTARPIICAIEINEKRLRAAKAIAELLGVGDRIAWCVGAIGHLPFRHNAFDTVFAIEVIEHLSSSQSMIKDIGRICRGTLVVTTPNKLFPIIHHDTRLPFCHWLPIRWRSFYASVFRREHRQASNRFWSPHGILRGFGSFDRVSGFLHFSGWAEYAEANAALPQRLRKSGTQHLWYWFTSFLGPYSSYLLPNCSMAMRRRCQPPAQVRRGVAPPHPRTHAAPPWEE
jgi:2-polyprenyl-3-methyl-5-hydroxy-6-metoxy-1,4-benzoquinol methylase